jgi:hypothetical protein
MSTKVNFAANRKKAEDAGLLGGGQTFNKTIRDGDNRFRLVSECLEHPGEFTDKSGVKKKTFKWLGFVLDRADGQVKPYFMPNNVYEQIEALQLNPEFAFDEVPMPYDLNLNVKNAGKLDVVYIVQGARTNTPLTADELAKIATAGSIREYQKLVYEKDNQNAPTELAAEQPSIREDAPLPEPPPVPSRYANIPEEFRPKV